MRIVIKDVQLELDKDHELSHFDFSLESGQMGGLYGTRDSAKTWLLMAVAGIFKVKSGEILVGNESAVKSPAVVRRMVGLAASPSVNPLISHLSVKDNFRLQANALHVKHANARIEEMAERFGIRAVMAENVDRLPEFLAAKTGLAMALLNDPAVVLVDEPERRLTTEEARLLMNELEMLREAGKTIMYTTRQREWLTACDVFAEVAWNKGVYRIESVAADVSRA